jgi:penicillin-binding protein 2
VRGQIEYAEKARTANRTRVVVVLFTAAYAGLLCMLWFTQVIQGTAYSALAADNMVRSEAVEPLRGNILDREGRLVVQNRLSFNVLLQREGLSNRDEVLAFLSEALALPVPTLAARLDAAAPRPRHEPVVMAEDVSLAEAVKVEARRLEWPMLSIVTTARRSYPEQRLAAHVLGYVSEISEAEMVSGTFGDDLRGGDIVGKAGIERVYETELQGAKGLRRVAVNSHGRVVEEIGLDREPSHGSAVTLTLDLDLQRELERGMEGHVGAAVFLDPWSGAVLAMASSPAFEPNFFARRFPPEEWKAILSDPLKPLQDRASLSRYSPGSTFKIVVAAAALEEGLVTPSTTITCRGSGVFYGHRFHCHKLAGHGPMDFENAIIHSCNIYFYTLGKALGIETIASYARRLGLGERTGIDLVSEEEGLVPTPEWKRATRGEPWYPGETISVSIGGGLIAATPLQMARLAASLANGGRPMQPHLHSKGAEEAEMSRIAHAAEPVLSEGTLAALRRAMVGVVNRGTGQRARLEDVQVAAKTGTAQFSARSQGVDADDLPYAIRDHAWLIGFAPATDPTIAFAIIIEHGGHGGTTAAPVARRVLERYFGGGREPEAASAERAAADGTARESGGAASP